jgi:hypothetical protein
MASISLQPTQPLTQAWFAPLLEHGSTYAAENLRTSFAFLQAGEHELPLSINSAELDNCWLCSPYTHFISYADEEIRRATPAWLGRAATLPLRPAGRWMRRCRLNQVIMVNQWLLSTTAWPAVDPALLPQMLSTITQRWPEHALIFRCLNAAESEPLKLALKAAGARLIPSRQVWRYDRQSPRPQRSRDYRNDVRLLHSNDLQRVSHADIPADAFPALAALYDQLYVQKYSQHNPRYTAPWLHHLWQQHLLHFTALRSPTEDWLGVEACGEIHGVLTSPVIGYDLSQPQSLGLYRRLSVIAILEAQRRGLPLNLSSGVGRYKALRGAEPVMEYLGVYDRHLPRYRQRPWAVIQWISQHLLAPYVRKHGL